MRNWIRNHKYLAVSMAIILCLAAVTSYSYFTGGKSSPVGSGLRSAVYTVEKPLSLAAENVRSFFSGIINFRATARENEELKAEIADLKKNLIDESLKQQDLIELRELSESLKYNFPEESQTLITANVSASGLSDWVGSFIVDRGRDDGVYENAVVVSAEGLVGTVTEVGKDWARVLTILDDDEKISFRVFRKSEYLGIMEGGGDGTLSGYMLSSDASVVEGDLIITSNMGIYPEGIEIGRISKVVNDRDAQLIKVEIEASADVNLLRKVVLIL